MLVRFMLRNLVLTVLNQASRIPRSMVELQGVYEARKWQSNVKEQAHMRTSFSLGESIIHHIEENAIKK